MTTTPVSPYPSQQHALVISRWLPLGPTVMRPWSRCRMYIPCNDTVVILIFLYCDGWFLHSLLVSRYPPCFDSERGTLPFGSRWHGSCLSTPIISYHLITIIVTRLRPDQFLFLLTLILNCSALLSNWKYPVVSGISYVILLFAVQVSFMIVASRQADHLVIVHHEGQKAYEAKMALCSP